MGAAVLSAKACIRSGVGLVTVHVPALGVSVLQTTIPEVMCSVDTGDASIESLPKLDHFSAIGMGPGIGKEKDNANALKRLLQDCNVSLVLDADALNILAENKTWLSFLPANTVLTPHPKEFDRLAGPSESGHERWKKQREFAMRYNCVVVLKGAYTSVCNPAGQTFFNSTGNAGMATAGSGDALTGLIVGLLAQGYSPTEAAIVGVYLHGLAGDIAAKKQGQEAMIASDIIKAIGSAFLHLTT
jgi:NAD(P)H-hydrate epimerase